MVRRGRWVRDPDEEDKDLKDLVESIPKIPGLGALESMRLRKMRLLQVHLAYFLSLRRRLDQWRKSKQTDIIVLDQELRRRGLSLNGWSGT